MGLFDSFMELLDEKSDNSLEKKILRGIDKVEHTVGATVDKAESGIKKVDELGKKTTKVIDTIDQQAKKITPEQDK